MNEYSIRVSVVRYPDRKFLMMRYVDPITGKATARSTKTTNRREAERAAAKWEAELQAGAYHKPQNISWAAFRERCEDEKLSALSPNTLAATLTAFNHLERLVNPKNLTVITPQVLSRFQADLRKSGMRETTIATHLRHLRAALGWAVSMKLLAKRPEIEMPKLREGADVDARPTHHRRRVRAPSCGRRPHRAAPRYAELDSLPDWVVAVGIAAGRIARAGLG